MASTQRKCCRSSESENGRAISSAVTSTNGASSARADLLRPDEERLQAALELRRVGRAGSALFLEALREEKVPGQVIAGDEAVHLLRRPGRPPAQGADALAGVGEEVPQRLDAPHVAGDRRGALAAGLVHDEMADAVLVRGLAGGDRRPEDGRQHRLEALEPPIGAAAAGASRSWGACPRRAAGRPSSGSRPSKPSTRIRGVLRPQAASPTSAARITGNASAPTARNGRRGRSRRKRRRRRRDFKLRRC